MYHFLTAATIDDLLNKAYTHVLHDGVHISPTNGPATELFGVLFQLTRPQSRISRSQNRERVFSALGELLWYLSGSDDPAHISYYVSYYKNPEVSHQGRVIGAYGPRLLNFDEVNQLETAIATLRRNPESRNAVIQLFDHEDPTRHAPCTLALQFAVREGKLMMMTTMRSNDLFLGFPHDLFAFTMLQEIVARSLGVELGHYYHSVGSLHLYDEKIASAEQYLNEGWHDDVAMPAMPSQDPWDEIRLLLETEKAIRLSTGLDFGDIAFSQEPYWRDLGLLLYAYKLITEDRLASLSDILDKFSDNYFRPLIQERIDRISSRKTQP